MRAKGQASEPTAHAAVQWAADQHGIDVLHIKGPAVDASLLEQELVGSFEDPGEGAPRVPVARTSVDADVLVRPSQVRRLLRVLRQSGWQVLTGFRDGSEYAHAATLFHPSFGSLDVHRRFPGFGAKPEDVFERLWVERREVELAGKLCPVPSITAQRLVLISHAVRSRTPPTHADLRRTWFEAEPSVRLLVDELAQEIGAEVVLGAARGRLAGLRDRRDFRLWSYVAAGTAPSPAAIWLARVKAEPTFFARVRMAIHVARPKPRRIWANEGRAPTRREILEAYAGRGRVVVKESIRCARAAGRRLVAITKDRPK